MTPGERARFDALFEQVVADLPPGVVRVLDEVAVVIEDSPTRDVLDDLDEPGMDPEELCGLHTGVPETERSFEEGPVEPPVVHLFRLGIVSLAGGWSGHDADERIREEIRITLLHEIGHHFGLDEDDLADLGYD